MIRTCLLALLLGTLIRAQQAPAAGAPKANPTVRTEIQHLLQTMHVDDVLKQELKTAIPPMVAAMKQNPAVTEQFADEFAKQFEARLLESHELSDMIVDAYASRFSLMEIRQLEAFYNSAIGRKLVNTQPELMAEVSKKAGAFGQSMAMEVTNQIAKDHPEYMKKESVDSPAPKQ